MSSRFLPIILLALLAVGSALPAQAATPDTAKASTVELRTVPSLATVSIAELEARMKKGDLRAQAELGARYGRGDGVTADIPKAIALLKAAAAKKSPEAQHWLATAYQNGIGVKKDEAQAVALYKQAAEQGHPEAQYLMGQMISTGQAGFTQSWADAIPYFWKSADQGLPLAEFMMGYIYQLGHGVAPDAETAAYWYRRTLTRGPYREATANLGLLLGKKQIVRQPGDPDAIEPLTEKDVDLGAFGMGPPAGSQNPAPQEAKSQTTEAVKGVTEKLVTRGTFAAEDNAASFRLELSPRGYVVYSTYNKPVKCEINIYYMFTQPAGDRREGESLCLRRDIPQGKDVEFCKFAHRLLVDPSISKPPKVTCIPS